MSARFTLTRGKFGSPIVFDNDGKRPVLVLLRDTDMPDEAADVAAMNMGRFIAQTLSQSHERAMQARKPSVGGR
ncbi:MAG: hypothetical protein CVU73_15825 [Deltaproteobacteria bacterium HGW-Deltaproteobacteria-8]|jgi:hypothetical protein|nr:MAG: hypothetical protein CVU73_15825 [Deltaproteobacteria bacterium HGW-Deltaproteobacteria-8]